MSVELDPRYQVEAYDKMTDSLKRTKRAGIIMPTGTGKTYLALKLIEDSYKTNNQILYVSPSPTINAQVIKIIKENYSEKEAKEILSKVKFTTYQELQQRYKTDKEEKTNSMEQYNSDTIILDEVHRSGAEKWGEAIDYLLEKNENANILGMTATPLRNDGRNMIEERFGGVTYELTISEAVARGILKLPQYISSRHITKDEIESLDERLNLIEDEELKKKLQDKLDAIRGQIHKAENLSEVYKRHLKPDGKYIVFCKPGDDIEALQKQAKKRGDFNKVNKIQEFYIVESLRDEEENKRALRGFEKSGKKRKYILVLRNGEKMELGSKKMPLKLLYSKNMLNEGYHHRHLSGIIMARPTKSYPLFVQQLGRVLSRDGEETPLVLDLVGNIRYFKQFQLEVINIIKEGIARGEKVYDEKVIDSFRILEEQVDFVKAFEEIETSIKEYEAPYMQRSILEIERWCKAKFKDAEKWDRRLPNSNSTNQEEKQLGQALGNLKKRLKPYKGKSLKEIEDAVDRRVVEKLRILEEEYAFGQNQLHYNLGTILKIENWCKTKFKDAEKWDRRLPNCNSTNQEEKQLGRFLESLRPRLKQYEGKSLEEIEDYEDKRLVKILRRLDEEYAFGIGQLHYNLGRILKIENWCKTKFKDAEKWDRRLPNRSSTNQEEKNLSVLLTESRRRLKKYEGKSLEKIEDTEDRRVVEILRRLDEEYAFGIGQLHYNLGIILKIENWCKTKSGDREKWDRRLPNSYSTSQEEKQLGQDLANLKTRLKPYEGKSLEEIEDAVDRRVVKKLRSLEEEYAFGEKQLHYNLGTILKIENWCKTKFKDAEKWDRRLPNSNSTNQEEKQLGQDLGYLRTRLKQYEGKSLEEIEDSEDKRLVKILRRLDEEYAFGIGQLHYNLGTILKIGNWCKTKFKDAEKWDRRLPNCNSTNQEEKQLGRFLESLRPRLKQYEGKSLEEIEDYEDKRLVKILRRLDEEYAFGIGQLHYNLGRILKIENWCKTKFKDAEKWDRRLPNRSSTNQEEKQLGQDLGYLRTRLKRYEGKSLEEIKDSEDRRIVEILRRLDEEYNPRKSKNHNLQQAQERRNNARKTNYVWKRLEGKVGKRLKTGKRENHEEQ